MTFGALGVLARVALSALRSRLPWPSPRRRLPAASRGVPVFVMLPLDAWSPGCAVDLADALPRLAAAGVHGIMVDVWWGVCEARPGVYDFEAYKTIARICRDAGLAMQATISLHACGGNVGDSVNIPLPEWVVEAGDTHQLWYKDRQGYMHRECLALSADNVKALPVGKPKSVGAVEAEEDGDEARKSEFVDSAVGNDDAVANATADMGMTEAPDECEKRTPLDAYQEFIAAFLGSMGEELLNSTVVELQVGCGPCGELRYPSYPLGSGMWEFPGMGELQCFDYRMLDDLRDAAEHMGHPEDWGTPPVGTGTYNGSPHDSDFFSRGHASPRGVFFLQWYSNALLEHGRNMLDVASAAIARTPAAKNLTLAVKVSGIHWWKLSRSRAAEAAAGYYVSRNESAYQKIAELLRGYNGVMDFTCLEMRTWDQPFLKSRCGPRQLVAEVFKAAEKEGVRVAGENALERYDWGAYEQILKAYQSVRSGGAYGFTMLRLGPTLLEEANFAVFQRFVSSMAEL